MSYSTQTIDDDNNDNEENRNEEEDHERHDYDDESDIEELEIDADPYGDVADNNDEELESGLVGLERTGKKNS